MTIPALLLSLLLASLYGVTFYLFLGHGWLRLAIYWLVALFGFALGQFATSLIGFRLLPLGSVNVVEASIVSFAFLWVTRALWK